MKSAYELALERMEKGGIEPPREGGLPTNIQQEMAEIRSRATARLAELEILHRDQRSKGGAAVPAPETEENYLRDRRRIEEQRDAKLERLRRRADSDAG